MKAETYTPDALVGWWGRLDQRLRCRADNKVVFDDHDSAQRSAINATNRGTPMKAYVGQCGHWHTSRTKKRKHGA